MVDAHEKIFGDDPFLMADETQDAYREAMIKHLLLYRTRKTTTTFDVDLFNENEWARFDSPAPPSPAQPDGQLGNHYHAARANRAAVTDKDIFDKLKKLTVVSDSSHTIRRREKNGYPTHSQAQTKLAKAGKRPEDYSTLDRRLRIAVVGYRVMVSLIPDQAYLGEDLCIFRPPVDLAASPDFPERDWLVPLGRTRSAGSTRHWKDALAVHIERALGRNSHIVMLPEFALPPASGDMPGDFERTVRELSTRSAHHHFLLAGTRHEASTNRALVLAKQDQGVSKFWPQYKIASARNMGENVLGPRGGNFPAYSVTFAIPDRRSLKVTIMVAICYDAFDPTIFLKLCRIGATTYSANGSEHLIILVPSFNRSEDFVALLRDLSFLTRSLVIYGDALNGNAKLFYCGIALSDLYEKKENLEGKLETAINELVRKYDIYKGTRRAAAGRDQMTAEAARAKIARMRHKRDISRAFKKNLDVLRRRGALDCLVTVEPKANTPSDNPRLTDDDLLYYNLDIELLDVLKTFREDFFLNDDFLPRALQLEELGTLD